MRDLQKVRIVTVGADDKWRLDGACADDKDQIQRYSNTR